MLISLTD